MCPKNKKVIDVVLKRVKIRSGNEWSNVSIKSISVAYTQVFNKPIFFNVFLNFKQITSLFNF